MMMISRRHPSLLGLVLGAENAASMAPPCDAGWEDGITGRVRNAPVSVADDAYTQLLPVIKDVDPELFSRLRVEGMRSPDKERWLQIVRCATDLVDFVELGPLLDSIHLPPGLRDVVGACSGQAEQIRHLIRELPSQGEDWWWSFLRALDSHPDNVTLRPVIQEDAEGHLQREEERRAAELAARVAVGAGANSDGWGAGFGAAATAEDEWAQWEELRKRSREVGPSPASDELGKAAESYTLRLYQEELAKRALEGRNAVLVAPTGSGKTLVAVHAIRHHLTKRAEEGMSQKVVFIVPTTPLAEQQCRYLRRYLRDRWRVGKIVGGGSEAPKGHLFAERQVIVMTPDCLLFELFGLKNMLETPSSRDRVRINDISMIVFDECHHCDGKHAYMSVMLHYLDLKQQQKTMPVEGRLPLPQILGMTAALGSGKAGREATLEAAKLHALQLAASLDAAAMATVLGNPAAVESLAESVPTPEDRLEQVAPDHHRLPFAIHVNDTMADIEKAFEPKIGYLIRSNTPALEGIKAFVSAKQRFGEAYGQRLSTLLAKLPALPDSTSDKRDLITMAQHLKIYQTSLELQSQVPTGLAFEFLQRRFEEVVVRMASPLDARLDDCRADLFRKLAALPDPSQDNSLVKALYETLKQELIREGSDPSARAIVFVRTRELAHALAASVAAHRGLASTHPVVLTSANTRENMGGQSPEDQKAALAAFREGRSRVMVATTVGEEGLDIPSCNLVVKYNHVSSDTAMIQKRGRGRADKSTSVLIIQESEIASRELANKRREVATLGALQEIVNAGLRAFQRKVGQMQEYAAGVREDEAKLTAQKQQKLGDVKYELLCRKCDAPLCSSDAMRRVKGAHYVVTAPDIWTVCVVMPHQSPQSLYEVALAGRLECGKCRHPLGTVIRYRSVFLPTLKAAELVLAELDRPANRLVGRQWKIIEETKFLVKGISESDLGRMHESLLRAAADIDSRLQLIVAKAESELLGEREIQENVNALNMED